jgi:hypothetical protein
MKKYAIVIIGLVFAALVFGSCELPKGGTIKVENKSNDYSVIVYVTKKALNDDITKPPDSYVAKKTIAAGKTGEISIGEDGTYYVKPFFQVTVLGYEEEWVGTAEPLLGAAVLVSGNTVTVKVDMILK